MKKLVLLGFRVGGWSDGGWPSALTVVVPPPTRLRWRHA